MVALLVLLTVLVFLTLDYLVQRRRQAVPGPVTEPAVLQPVVVRDPEYRTPMGVFFDPHHAWAFVEESGSALVGVDDLVRVVLGRVDRANVTPVGTNVRRGDPLIELFHDDRSLVVPSPFDGTVDAVNRPTNVDDGSLTEGWLCKVTPNDTSALHRTMLIGKRASEWLMHEVGRLRVFLATIAPQHPVLAQTMHDGGMPYAGVVEHLDDEEWRKLLHTFFVIGDEHS